MTDEQQMALAMQMSLATQQPDPGEVQMETSSGDAEGSPAPAQATSGVAEVTDSGSATTATDDVTKVRHTSIFFLCLLYKCDRI